MPRWWLWIFYATIVYSIGYVIAYPAIPLINGATEGALGWSSRAAVASEIEEHKEWQSSWRDRIEAHRETPPRAH